MHGSGHGPHPRPQTLSHLKRLESRDEVTVRDDARQRPSCSQQSQPPSDGSNPSQSIVRRKPDQGRIYESRVGESSDSDYEEIGDV